MLHSTFLINSCIGNADPTARIFDTTAGLAATASILPEKGNLSRNPPQAGKFRFRRDLFPKSNSVLLCEVAKGYFATKHRPAFLADLTLLYKPHPSTCQEISALSRRWSVCRPYSARVFYAPPAAALIFSPCGLKGRDVTALGNALGK